MTSFQDSSFKRCDQKLAQRKCLMPVLFSGVKTVQMGRKVLDFIRYLFMEKTTRRKKWVDFVQLKPAHWKPTKYSALCSKHFRDDDFTVKFLDLTGHSLQPRLRKVRVCAFPTVHTRTVQFVRESKYRASLFVATRT